jgi:probable HAF family extracellular repeat protein
MAVRYTGGFWQSLPGLDASFSQAFGINAAGDIVGYRSAPAGTRAFRYTDANGVQDIEPLAGGSMTFGFAINDAGDVVGLSDASDGFHAFILRQNETTPVALPSLNGGFAYACGINNAGQVAGTSFTPTGAQHGMRIDAGAASAVDVGTLDGPNGTSDACAIDADGRVGGQSSAAGAFHAYRFVTGAPIDLDTFGSASSKTESIAAGVSVGWYETSPNVFRAFAHRDGDGSFDLNTRITEANWVLAQAKGVNASGAIAGEGTFMGSPAVFLLTPSAPADTTAPVISNVAASPSPIFPPNGLMTSVSVTVSATDDSGDAPVCSLDSITGGLAGDAIVTSATPPLAGSVRAVGGRTYTFHVSCHDAAGNSASSSVDVFVTPDTTAPVINSVSASPDNLWPPDNRLVAVTVTVSASDDVDASPVCALTTITGGAAGDATVVPPLGATLRAVGGTTYTLNVRCTDAAGNFSSAATTVVVPPDVTAPVIASVTPSQSMIWPPNGKMVDLTVAVSATDDVDAAPSCAVVAVTGGSAGDAVVTGPFSFSVRANKGTVYCVKVTCSDQAGNTSSKSAKVTISK